MLNFLLNLNLLLLFFKFSFFPSDWLVSSTRTLPVNIFFLEEEETLRQKATKNFRALGKNRTNDRILTDVVHSAGIVVYPI